MSSPGLGGLKSKKKYSGALFLENDEFDCFAEEARDESSEDVKPQKMELMKSLSRKESSHIGLSGGSRKFSKKIEEDENEDQEDTHKIPSHMGSLQKTLSGDPSKFNTYASNNTALYSDISKGFLPTSANKIGMNSIPTMPFMGHSLPQPPLATFSQPRSYADMAAVYQNAEPEEDDFESDSTFFGMSDSQVMQHFEEFISNQQDCKLLQSRAELKPSFFDLIFKHVSANFADYCVDPSTTVFATSVVDLALLDPPKIKQLLASFKGRVIQLCADTYGTRVVQRLVEKTFNKPDLFEMLVGEIRGNVCMLVMCNNGNHVVQKLVSQAKCPTIAWVYDEILDKFKALGTHKHGCCVVQRCIDNANNYYKVIENDQDKIAEAVAVHALQFVGDMYGNYVVQYVIEKPCSLEKKTAITEKYTLITRFVGKFDCYLFQKFGSNVLETFIKCKMDNFVAALCKYLTSKEALLACVCNQFGNYVVQTLLNNYQGDKLIEPVVQVA